MLTNFWYCAGWDYELSQGKDALMTRRIAGESIVLYRKPNGGVVAMEDRCCHRQTALSCGRKEGDSLRCMYHGWKFGPNGKCIEIPGQEHIPEQACVRSFPVVEKDNWIWVWMGDPEKADPALICFAIGPGDPAWNMRTSKLQINTNYRQELANLSDLSHIAWVHDVTFGGTTAWSTVKSKHTLKPRGQDTETWLRGVPILRFAQHLFPPEMLLDMHFDVQMTLPCNFVLHLRVFSAGTKTEGPSDGHLILDTYSCQAITPRDADSIDYYYSWGVSKATDAPGMADMLLEAIDTAFLEDKKILEAQHQRMKEKPNFKTVDYKLDAGPGKILWLLDKFLKEEAAAKESANLVEA